VAAVHYSPRLIIKIIINLGREILLLGSVRESIMKPSETSRGKFFQNFGFFFRPWFPEGKEEKTLSLSFIWKYHPTSYLVWNFAKQFFFRLDITQLDKKCMSKRSCEVLFANCRTHISVNFREQVNVRICQI
jgi:hypothetical protein